MNGKKANVVPVHKKGNYRPKKTKKLWANLFTPYMQQNS